MFRVFYYKTLNNHLDKKKEGQNSTPRKKSISLKSHDDFDDPEREREREHADDDHHLIE